MYRYGIITSGLEHVTYQRRFFSLSLFYRNIRTDLIATNDAKNTPQFGQNCYVVSGIFFT